jgi:hypothetical protein
VDDDVVQLHPARVGQALADVVPVAQRGEALTAARKGDERQLAVEVRGDGEDVAERRAGRERAAPIQAEGAVAVLAERDRAAAARVLDAAPEEALLAVAARLGVGLLGRAEQPRDAGLGVVVAEQVGDRRVAARDPQPSCDASA